MQDELVVVDPAPQVADQLEVLARVAVGAVVVEGVAGVRVLGGVHRDVGVLEQRLGVLAVLGVERDADARLDLDGELVELEPLGDRLAHARAGLDRGVGPADVGDQHRELVAAEAGDGVAGAQSRGQPRADRAQQQVAVVVAERVVDLLEAVEVDHQHGDLRGVARGELDRLVHAVVEEHAVGQFGDVVVQRRVLARGGVPRPRRDARTAQAASTTYSTASTASANHSMARVVEPRAGNLRRL